MIVNLLEILRCPFCGSPLSLERGESLKSDGEEIVNGIIFCQCSAYPIVAGIPIFTTDPTADKARKHLNAGEFERAFFTMLGIEEIDRQAAFRRYIEKGRDASYREGVEILCPDAERDYLIYRFSDPTYLAGQTLLRATGMDSRCFTKRAIDLCGGSGHLTRVLCQIAGAAEVLLADAYFWKLWLAKRFNAPASLPVCCDVNNPLPFERDTFSLTICSDAFHYIWSKRSLAGEIMRIAGQSGVIVLSHLHNALVENYSAGMPLAPRWWRALFSELNPRVFRESDLFDNALTGCKVDLSHNFSDEELSHEAALFLIATRLDGFFRAYDRLTATDISGELRVNPLYTKSGENGSSVLQLQFPSQEYEEEFGMCKRYLPEKAEIRADLLKESPAAPMSEELIQLIENRVLLDLPEKYL